MLLHDGTKQRVLTTKIIAALENPLYPQEQDQDQRAVFISRQYFDQDRGADLLRKVVITSQMVDSELVAKYTVLAG